MESFIQSCIEGNINAAKDAYVLIGNETDKYTNRIKINDLYLNVCKGKQNNVAKWLIDVLPIGKDVKYRSFYLCCIDGNLELAELIYSKSKHQFNIFDNDIKGNIFSEVCNKNIITVAKWLYIILNDIDIWINKIITNGYTNFKTIMISGFVEAFFNDSVDTILWMITLDMFQKKIKRENSDNHYLDTSYYANEKENILYDSERCLYIQIFLHINENKCNKYVIYVYNYEYCKTLKSTLYSAANIEIIKLCQIK